MSKSISTKKKRILMSTEASFTKSGFGKYTKEILQRLYNTGKYEIAEFASYAMPNDKRDNVPWRIYCNAVAEGDLSKCWLILSVILFFLLEIHG